MGISYTVLPGPSSILTALVGSGMENSSFVFYGFIPKKQGQKNALYQELRLEKRTAILFDTPHNIKNTIQDFKEIFPERKLCIARELSKKFEEYFISDIASINPDNLTLKGEFVLILSAALKDEARSLDDFNSEVNDYINQGLRTKEIVGIIKDKTEFSKNEIYEYVLNLSNK